MTFSVMDVGRQATQSQESKAENRQCAREFPITGTLGHLPPPPWTPTSSFPRHLPCKTCRFHAMENCRGFTTYPQTACVLSWAWSVQLTRPALQPSIFFSIRLIALVRKEERGGIQYSLLLTNQPKTRPVARAGIL